MSRITGKSVPTLAHGASNQNCEKSVLIGLDVRENYLKRAVSLTLWWNKCSLLSFNFYVLSVIPHESLF